MELEETRNYVFYDPETHTYPFGVAFYMFRSGAHKSAFEYLSHFKNDKISRFGELYKEFVTKFNFSLPVSQVNSFYKRC